MSNAKTPNDLQALLNELTQSDEVRRKRIRKRRFDERATDYAQAFVEEETYNEDDIYHLLIFQLGDERYGINVDAVTGVRPAESITRVPGIPAYYRGVINVRGQIITVLDLRRFFGLEASDAKSYELITIEAFNLHLALLANRVEEVQRIPRTTVQAIDMRYAHGVTADQLVIIDLQYLLTDERLIIGGEII